MKNYVRRTRRLVGSWLGTDIYPRLDVRANYVTLGNPDADWGIIPDVLRSESIIYSVGVGEDISFDLELIRRYGVTVHAFDPTPRSITWIRQQLLDRRFILHEYGLAGTDTTLAFYPPQDSAHISHSAAVPTGSQAPPVLLPVRSLPTIMRELGHTSVDVLKMDIEGSEYEVIDAMRHTGTRPQQILVEFHHRLPGVGIHRTERAIQQLREMDYQLYYVADSGQEMSFLCGSVTQLRED